MAKLKPTRSTAARIKPPARPVQRASQPIAAEQQAAEPISEQAEPGVAAHQHGSQQARQLQWMQRTLGNAHVQRMLSDAKRTQIQRAAGTAKPASPQHDPRFQSVKARAAQAAARAKQHAPAKAKATEAQAAARGPANDVSSQAAAGHVKKMNEQKPGNFNKQAFIAALNQAIERITPRTQEQADEFKQSGKAGQLKDQVSGLVTKNKETSEHAIKTTTAAPPSPGNARPKSVTPMKPETTGAASGSIGAASAMPANKTAGETSLAQSKQALDQQMATAQVSEDQLKKSNEPAFTGALTAKKATESHAASAPKAFQAQEQTILGKARAEADVTANQALGGMHTTRSGALTRVGGKQTGAKTADEQKRAEVATRIETLFAKTKTDVTVILAGLDGKVTSLFERGESAARVAFENHVQQQMATYKKQRYSGPLGPARWLKDKLMPMPGEVNAFYQQGRQLYTSQMQRVISTVAEVVAGELNRAKASIAQGRQSIQEYVAGLPRDLRQVGQEAAENIQGQFEQLEQDVTAKQDALVQTLAQKYVDARGAVDVRITEMRQANQGLLGKARAALGGVIQTILELKNMLLGVLGRASGVIGTIIKDPIRFLGNLVGAVKQGLHQFVGNIGKHLQQGLMGWLFGALGQSGLRMPETLDMKGMLSLIVQVMGITYANIRTRAVKLVGERTVGLMEGSVRVFQLLVSEGPVGLWHMMQDKLGDLKDQVLDQIKNFVITRIITAGVTWLVSLFNPASAFIKACKAIFDLIMFFIERGSQIAELGNAIIDSVAAIAGGSVGAAAGRIERTLGKALPVAISFLASLLGLGGIGQSMRKIIGSVQKPVNSAIDAVVKTAASGFKKLSGGSKRDSGKLGQPAHVDQQPTVQAGLAVLHQQETKYARRGKLTRADAEQAATDTRKMTPVFKSIGVLDTDKKWKYTYTLQRAEEESHYTKAEDEANGLTTLPSDLRSLRDSLSNPIAIDEFDRIIKADGVAKAGRAFSGMQRSSIGLEAQLIAKHEQRTNPPTVGVSEDHKKQLAELSRVAEQLKSRIKAEAQEVEKRQGHEIRNIQSFLKRIDGEIGFANKKLHGQDGPVIAENIDGCRRNLDDIRAEWDSAKAREGLVGIGVNMPYTNGEGASVTVDVDNLAKGGEQWIEVKNKGLFGKATASYREVEGQVEKLARAAQQNLLPGGKVPRIIVYFPKGVTLEVKRALEGIPGVAAVEGEVKERS